jgi:hypothetical protein
MTEVLVTSQLLCFSPKLSRTGAVEEIAELKEVKYQMSVPVDESSELLFRVERRLEVEQSCFPQP